MELKTCPYCHQQGLVTTVRSFGGGVAITGQCLTCGYRCDSDVAPAEAAQDLPGEFSHPLDVTAPD
jgi:C4-type Zn-finger protein